MKQRHSVTDGWNRFPRVERLWLPGEGESGKISAGHPLSESLPYLRNSVCGSARPSVLIHQEFFLAGPVLEPAAALRPAGCIRFRQLSSNSKISPVFIIDMEVTPCYDLDRKQLLCC